MCRWSDWDVDNYATWCVRMRFTLISKGLWKHVINDGEVTDTDGDQKALALIGLSVMDHHLPIAGAAGDGKGCVGRAGGCVLCSIGK